MIIIHGENLFSSRKALQAHIDAFRDRGFDIEREDAKKLTLGSLDELLGTQNLFGSQRVIIIEGLHSLQTSKQKNALITAISKYEDDIILWEKRALTKPMLKKFGNAKVESFAISKKMFAWLETLGSGDQNKKHTILMDALEQEDEYLCFVMLARQIRLLIQVKETGTAPGAPFMVQKLVFQAKKFSLEQLLRIHQRLRDIDRAMKTSRLAGTLSQQLDLLTITG